ncbi:FtsL-like putative cell division protein, partial [Bacteroidia bacterium]|nr:FtsL-like putative cell division protein [Bacteroidia bacterium]
LRLTPEWIYYLFFLFGLALTYIYLSHRTDNIVRDIESTKKNLIELRAENITLKSDIMKNRLRENLEKRLSHRDVKEPNRAVTLIKKHDVE